MRRFCGIGFVAALCAAALISAAKAEETIKVGVIQPQAGDCAQWGIPITRGVEMWAEELNAGGGIKSGDGKQYQIEVLPYDNVCYVPGDELKAARRAVLDDKVDFLLQTYTPGSRQAVADLVTENKVLTTSYGAGFLDKDRPYLLGGVTGSPTSYMLVASRIIEAHPEVKNVALLMADNSFGLAAKAYAEAGLAPWADKIKIVYNKPYDPARASDILGLLTPVMEAKPDVIIELGLVPEQKGVLLETAAQLGFTGFFGSEEFNINAIKNRGLNPADFAGRLYSAYVVEASEPTFSPKAHEFYKRYIEKYGADQWSGFAGYSYAAMGAIQAAVEATPSMDHEKIMNTLYGMEIVNHPILGPSKWGGQEIFGAAHHLLTPLPIYTVSKEGDIAVDTVIDVGKWWSEHGSAALPALKAGGQVYAK